MAASPADRKRGDTGGYKRACMAVPQAVKSDVRETED